MDSEGFKKEMENISESKMEKQGDSG